jgi:hypothetical protein
MDWFEQLTGFAETSWDDTRQRLKLQGRHLVSQVDGRRLDVGDFEMVALGTLRQRARTSMAHGAGRLTMRVVTGNVRDLHTDASNARAVFQVASQFNMLEMVAPHVTPEDGITRYQGDPTQGPACAMAAGGATIFRNHFVRVDDHGAERGQTRTRQLDGLGDVGTALSHAIGVPVDELWAMRNGYALCRQQGLEQINALLNKAQEPARDHLRSLLRIGVHRHAEVTWGARWDNPAKPPALHTVTQAFCSALPVAYGEPPVALWEPLARLVLEAAYEATLWEAVANASLGGSKAVHLTLLGGGAFGNEEAWIVDALRRALTLARHCPLEVRLVSYDGRASSGVMGLVREFG